MDEKRAKLRGLKDVELEVLFYIMADRDVKIKTLTPNEKMGKGESTIRAYLSNAFSKLGVPDNVDDQEKRKILHRDYAKIYREMYPTLERAKTNDPVLPEDTTPVTNWPNTPLSEAPRGSQEASTTSVQGEVVQIPQVFVSPSEPEHKKRSVPLWLVGILMLAAVAISLFVGIFIGGGMSGTLLTFPTRAPTNTITPVNTQYATTFTPTISVEQSPAPGSVIEANRSFQKNGKMITIQRELMAYSGSDLVEITGIISNLTEYDFVFRYTYAVISVTDDVGTQYYVDPYHNSIDSLDELITKNIYSGKYDRFIISVKPNIPVNAKKIIVHISEMADMVDMTWEIPLY